MKNNKTRIFSVSRINSLIKGVLEDNLPGRLTVAGEITDWKVHHSGHRYFSLKDENAVLPCVMWKSSSKRVKFDPENGLAVLATGFIDVYLPQGKYQFYVDSMQPAGLGALQLAFQQMVERLRAEGLFNDEHKQPLPQYPMRIAILTSKSGAAVADIRNSIQTRWPCAKLLLYPVPVQGEGAAEKIAAALRDVNARNSKLKLDVLIVGRGGGSLEDLWAFNEECLARAIYDSKIPVISAVGHEIDITIADLVADKRASTPTKAGVTAVPDIREVTEQLTYFGKTIIARAGSKLELCQKNLQMLLASAVFKNPLIMVRNAEQQLDELSTGLFDSAKGLLAKAKTDLHRCYEQIVRIEPHRLLGKRAIDLSNLRNRISTAVRAAINKHKILLTAQANRLAALNPKAVLRRGYTITTSRNTGRLVRALTDVKIGDLLITELAEENLIESEVKNKQNRTIGKGKYNGQRRKEK